jgi:hypothetical protein
VKWVTCHPPLSFNDIHLFTCTNKTTSSHFSLIEMFKSFIYCFNVNGIFESMCSNDPQVRSASVLPIGSTSKAGADPGFEGGG